MNHKKRAPILIRLLLSTILLLIGVLAGMLVQKYFGLGNILRAIGIPYPTAGPSTSDIISTREIPRETSGANAALHPGRTIQYGGRGSHSRGGKD